MSETDVDPLSPRRYCRRAIEDLRREIDAIRAKVACEAQDQMRLSQAEYELQLTEAELASIEPHR